MNSRERLIATLAGKPVDRPAVSFYEVGGYKIDSADPDPFNIYNSPSWRPLLDLTEEHTDIIRFCEPVCIRTEKNMWRNFFTSQENLINGSKVTTTKLNIAGRTMTTQTRRDPDVNTVWTIEHLLKDVDDLKAYLELPDDIFSEQWDVSRIAAEDRLLGDTGIVMIDTPDPLCMAAALFSMDTFVIIAFTERELFHKLLQKFAKYLYKRTQFVSNTCPGLLWRIYGPEYACEPYLSPDMFNEYVVRYTGPMIKIIQGCGGIARVHSHGRIKNILPHIAAMGADAIDPIEPPHQGDIELSEVRTLYGNQMVLFGNIEITDIENLEPFEFEKKVRKALIEGTAGKGRGFVLMPSASPYGREISAKTMTNYETIVRLAENWD
jgi:hypothetical protein